MIRVLIKAPFIGNSSSRVFYPACGEAIKNLLDQGIRLYMERNTALLVEEDGYSEPQKETVIQVLSDEKLSEPQIHDLETKIRALIPESFYHEDWGEITFIFSVATFSF